MNTPSTSPDPSMRSRRRRPAVPAPLVMMGLAAVLLVAAAALPLHAQQRTLSLEEAMRLAEGRSEAVRVARAGAARAGGQHLQARSGRLPQLNAVVQYQRTLRSQFSALAGGGGASPDSGGIDFSSVGFGAANQWVAGLDFSQNLFTFGRLEGASDAARAAQRAAAIELTSQRALAVLEVAQAYYDAALAERLVAIADSTRGQTEDVLRQTRLARQVGSVAEFDLLRAQVAYQNTLPVAITARGARDVAFLRLKQLLDIPLEETVALTTAIDETPGAIPLPAGLSVASIQADAVPGDTSVAVRSVVRQAEENLRAQEALVRIARAERYPAIALTSSYQRLFFPRTTLPDLGRFSENWTIGVGARVTLLSGGRVRGGEIIARANADDARARLDQVRELAALDARIALNELAQAQAAWASSQGTVEQAQRAYRIDQVRFAEGIATQTDLAQTRILLQQATANRATAARDLAVARVRLALISDLPLGAGGGAQGGMPQRAGSPQGSGGSGGPPPPQQGSSSQGAPGAAATSLGGMPQ